MFDNIGTKVKNLAVILAIISTISGLIYGFIIMKENFGLGLIIIIISVLISWVSSWGLYAIGEIAENSEKIMEQNQKLLKILSTNVNVKINKKEKSTAILNEQIPKEDIRVSSIENIECKDEKNVPIRPLSEDEKIICPICKTKQNADRNICWKCSQKFINESNKM